MFVNQIEIVLGILSSQIDVFEDLLCFMTHRFCSKSKIIIY